MAVARPDIDDEFDEAIVDPFGDDAPPQPWHNSTGAVVGASLAGIALIAILVAAVMYVTGRQQPAAPVDFVDPSFSATASRSTSTTTATITSTTPLSTTEINAPLTTPSTTGPSDTTSSSGSESQTTAPPTFTRRPRETGGMSPTSRNRPRTNITRTLLPQQAG